MKRAVWLPGVVLALVVVGLATIYLHQRPSIEPTKITLPADGAEHQALRIRLPALNFGSTVTEVTGLRLFDSKDPSGRIILIGVLRSPVTPGHTQLHLRWRHGNLRIPATFVFDPQDSYSDGTPDFLRLHTPQDRQAFRNWFTSIADSQADDPNLPAEIDDCAALLRFAYREALLAHHASWLSSHPTEALLPSIVQYAYPQTPLGANLFRIRPGPFHREDIENGSFAQFADARTLMERNTYLVARDLRLARPGDLIFYRQLDQNSPYDVPGATHYHSPFHSMVFCGEKGSSITPGPSTKAKGRCGACW